ncbi:MAG: hypothetical protein WC831_00325 [Parcubacteria group bacterium]|jgi:hypothetical protein
MSTSDSFEVEVLDEEKGLYKASIESEKQPAKTKLKNHWQKYGEKIILFIGILLIAGISFEAGFLKGKNNQKGTVEVSQIACAPCPKDDPSEESGKNSTASVSKTASEVKNKLTSENKKCAFVASKNSNKYHLSTCQFAQKIKAENRICFSSKEEAESRGYQGAKCCIK